MLQKSEFASKTKCQRNKIYLWRSNLFTLNSTFDIHALILYMKCQ